MANTINQNVIVPEVYASLVREKIAGKVKVAQFLVNLGDLHGKVGETLTMPKWAYIGDASVGIICITLCLQLEAERLRCVVFYDTLFGVALFWDIPIDDSEKFPSPKLNTL